MSIPHILRPCTCLLSCCCLNYFRCGHHHRRHHTQARAHTHKSKKLLNAKPLQANGQLSFSSGHQNNEGDIVMWLGTFLQGTITEIALTGSVNGAVQSA